MHHLSQLFPVLAKWKVVPCIGNESMIRARVNSTRPPPETVEPRAEEGRRRKEGFDHSYFGNFGGKSE
jgi:hypothetical protein